MRKGAASAVLAAATLFASGVSASAAPLPSDFFGVSSPDLIKLSESARGPILSDQRAAGVRLLRQIFDWNAIEASEGSYDWTATDSFMRSAAGADMKSAAGGVQATDPYGNTDPTPATAAWEVQQPPAPAAAERLRTLTGVTVSGHTSAVLRGR